MVTSCRAVFAPLVTLNQVARVFLCMDSCSCAMNRTWFIAVQSLSCVQLFATPWTAACRAPLSSTISQSLLRFVSSDGRCHPTISSSAIPFSHPQSFPASGSFLVRQRFASGAQRIGASASVSGLPSSECSGGFPLGWTGARNRRHWWQYRDMVFNQWC